MESPIIRKIRALLAKTVEKGCTEEEEEAASRMAAGLMIKHQLDPSQCGPSGASTGTKPPVKRRRISQEFKKYQITVAMSAARLYACKIVLFHPGLEFIGRADNCEASEITFFHLLSQLEKQYKAHLPKGLSKTERAEYRRTFKVACSNRIYERTVKLVHDLQDAASVNSQSNQALTGCTALVVKGYFDTCLEEAQAFIDEEMTVKQGRRGRGTKIGSGTFDGFRAGDKVQLKHAELET